MVITPRVFENGVLRKAFAAKGGRKSQGSGENCVMWTFLNCSFKIAIGTRETKLNLINNNRVFYYVLTQHQYIIINTVVFGYMFRHRQASEDG